MEFTNPILNASGCWSADLTQVHNLYKSGLGGVVLKTCTLKERGGNPVPNYWDMGSIKFNCKGVPNNGYYYYKSIALHYRDKPIVLSLLANDLESLRIMLEDYDSVCNEKRLVELNVSCPNDKERIIGYHCKDLKFLLDFLKGLQLKNISFSLKLPPYFEKEKIKKLAFLFLDYCDLISYIICSNAIPNGYLVLHHATILSAEYGGISGGLNKWISLGNVRAFHKILKGVIKIIGCGGILTEGDIQDYLNQGASLVQLGSGFYNARENVLYYDKINDIVKNFKFKK